MKLLKLSDEFEKGKFSGKKVSVVINKGETDYLKYFLSRNKDYRLHKEVITMIQSKYRLDFNSKLLLVLTSIDSNVSKKLLYLNKRKRVSTIFTNVKAFNSKKDTVVYDVPFGNKRNEIKIGRFVRKIFELNNIEFKDSDIEKFTSEFYAGVEKLSFNEYELKIVSGEDIRKYYHVQNYLSNTGTLGNSCMKHDNCQSKMDLYVYNPKDVEMLVMIHKNSDKVTARALLWRKSRIYNINEVYTFMDRIYTNNSKHEEIFKSYARENGFIYKRSQSYRDKSGIIHKGKTYDTKVTVELDNIVEYIDNRPYLDTFSYEVNDFAFGNQKLYNGYNVY